MAPKLGPCCSGFRGGGFGGLGIRGSSFFGLVKFVPRLAAAFSMAVWFGVVLHPTNLAVASLVMVSTILE